MGCGWYGVKNTTPNGEFSVPAPFILRDGFEKKEYEFLSEIRLSFENLGCYVNGKLKAMACCLLCEFSNNQATAKVVESSIEDFEEGMKACSLAICIWMQVSYVDWKLVLRRGVHVIPLLWNSKREVRRDPVVPLQALDGVSSAGGISDALKFTRKSENFAYYDRDISGRRPASSYLTNHNY
ncbi:hypothetical protein Ddye_023547 [Dipteronia dyeriana]|uniref:Uncharacterized protein n=1 Tax=Dipteronia dyeriana TaxID=168575 RepID=A0AAD9TT74_9ROSI|nr:hypothetical protein Ddye_023547 [Dipteronia dyeriana]